MKMTLLEMVQDILNDMDSDEVNSINDTIEAQQVAQILKTSFFELISNRNWSHLRKLIQLEASNDVTRPNYLKTPSNVQELEQIKYNKAKDDDTRLLFQDVTYKYPDEFLREVQARNTDLDYVTVVTDYSGIPIPVVTNQPPMYWTSFDDQYVVFDSYDSSVDDTLKSSKSQAYAYVQPTWEHNDTFVPNLPTDAFALLLEESKSNAFLTLKQMPNQKAEQRASRQNRWLSRKDWTNKGGIRLPNYGRK